jgi:hypothetical protein
VSASPAISVAGGVVPRPSGAPQEPGAARQTPASRRSRRRLVAVCVTLSSAFGALSLLGAFASEPGGPPSSSYSTGPDGVAAWATLLDRSGRSVSQLRVPLSRAPLPANETVMLLEPDALLHSDGARLMSFVRAGGLLLYGSDEPRTLVALLREPPSWSGSAPTRYFGRLGSLPGAAAAAGGARSSEVRTSGSGSWTSFSGYEAPLLASDGEALLLRRRIGQGTLQLLADVSPLQNRLLGSADNAQLGLDVAGPRSRPVVFVESVHGYGESRGVAALPLGWKIAFCGLALAGLLWVAARGRRLGPPERLAEDLSPPRSAYADAIAVLLRRTHDEQAVTSALDSLERK